MNIYKDRGLPPLKAYSACSKIIVFNCEILWYGSSCNYLVPNLVLGIYYSGNICLSFLLLKKHISQKSYFPQISLVSVTLKSVTRYFTKIDS